MEIAMKFRKTRIVCTIGPASSGEETLERLINAGMNVTRLNFSHGTHESHSKTLENIREASKRLQKPVAVLMDLCGPKIRLGDIAGGKIELEDGSDLVIRRGSFKGTRDAVSSTYEQLVDDLSEGDRVLMDDGLIELIVRVKTAEQVVCKVIHGGILKEHKGINLPGAKISSPSVTEKDLADLNWGIENKVDYVALSFVRRPEDVRLVRGILHKAESDIHVIAKIEKPEALKCIDEIIEAADGIMVARGDLGVEMNPDEVPPIQKDLIRRANEKDKPVITATQMLESMTENPRPTRAEVSDVANAIFDGTDAVMLSGETASGRYPVNTVIMMDSIARSAEEYMEGRGFTTHNQISRMYTTGDAICHGADAAARDLGAKLIAIYTLTGTTALLMSKYRPHVPILALSSRLETIRRMCLYRGVIPIYTVEHKTTEDMHKDLERIVLGEQFADRGDALVILTGAHHGKAGGTNSMKIHRIEVPLLTRSFRREDTQVACYEGGGVEVFFKPQICFNCGVCVGRCPVGVFEIEDGKVKVVRDRIPKCLKDMTCVTNCPVDAIKITEK
jgi:pyruvate kinase